MRRQQLCPSTSSGNSGVGEPLIVVEESTLGEEEGERCRAESPPRCVDPDSPSLNPYLLSPWREARKHSLPTPQCTSGITASQVRTHAARRKSFAVSPSPAILSKIVTFTSEKFKNKLLSAVRNIRDDNIWFRRVETKGRTILLKLFSSTN